MRCAYYLGQLPFVGSLKLDQLLIYGPPEQERPRHHLNVELFGELAVCFFNINECEFVLVRFGVLVKEFLLEVGAGGALVQEEVEYYEGVLAVEELPKLL